MSGKDLQPMASIRRSRRPLLSSCALASAMAALGHAPAGAQSFQGTVIGTPTNATVVNNVPGQTTVTVTAPTAIVNWQPTDIATGTAPITFQGAGTTATYQSNGSDYTVLNRIVPTGAASGRSVLLNGTINSYIGDATQNQRGGAVWFYSPNGLVIGSQASIDVGSLLLTTRNLTDGEFLSNTGIYNFGAADGSRSSVTIQAGAQINAEAVTGSSYVAVVAPRVVQAGTVRVGGSAAYVAAEQATITIGGGLFNIQVQSGSAVDAGTPGDEVTLSHTGSTTGPTLSSSGNPQAIYMVAIPKNVAITMLVGGNVGYDVNASVENNGTVILSAGSGVDSFGFLTGGPASGVGANLTIAGGSNFTSATRASARTDALAQTGAGGSLTFDKGFFLSGGRSATLSIGDNGTANIGRDLTVTTTNRDDADNAARGTAAITLGNNAALTATGGNVMVDASTDEFDDALGGFATVTAGAGSSLTLQSLSVQADARSSQSLATGGDATLSLTNASLDTQSLLVSASARGGNALNGGTGAGGNARVTLTNASIISESQISVDASGQGGGGGDDGVNGLGQGGLAQFTATGAATSVQSGGIQIIATGMGGFDATDGTGNGIGGGDGRGGTASFTYSGASVQAGQLTVSASGIGTDGIPSDVADFNGGVGGTGTGGTATASITAPTIGIGSVGVYASGEGGIGGNAFEIFDELGYGIGTSTNGGDGGNAAGGTAQLSIAGTLNASSIQVDASATAGLSGTSDFGQQGNGANAQGGSATFNLLANASANPGGLTVTAAGLASDGGATGGNGAGGDVSIGLAGGASLTVADSLTITADGTGGSGIARGGDGAGGDIALTVGTGGSFAADNSSLLLSARGTGGGATQGQADDVGGTATGGAVRLASTGGSISAFGLTLDASAQGGSSSGTGGDATGGDTTLDLNVGQLAINSSILLTADAFGGSGLSGGTATGGDIVVRFAGGGGLSSFGQFSASADAIGGNGAYSGNGGTGVGGNIDFTIADSSAGSEIEVGYGLSFEASGTGGLSSNDFSGTGAGGNGGDGIGGNIAIRTGSGAITSDFAIGLVANGTGGSVRDSGGNGGAGVGGDVTFDAAGATLNVSDINLDAGASGGGAAEFGYGAGGSGGNGGDATGGAARLLLAGGTINLLTLSIDTSATGGDGGGGNTHPVLGDLPGGNGGNATGGLALLDINGGTFTISGNADVLAEANGGYGGFSSIDTRPGSGGIATGGSGANGGALVNLRGGATLSAPNLRVSADAFGGDGNYSFSSAPDVETGANGGDGTGGRAGVTIANADLIVSQARISARGVGGNADQGSDRDPAPVGGSGTGGLAELAITGGSASFGTLNIDAIATGGGFNFVTAGNAQGGVARLTMSGGSLDVAESFSLDAHAGSFGGAGPAPSVTGGTAVFSATDAASITFDPGFLSIDAYALLQNSVDIGFIAMDVAAPAVTALAVGDGSATGGTATFTLDGTALALSDLVLDAGGYVEPAGASAQGGTATATISNGGALTVTGSTELLASGIASDGSPDGTGQGGHGVGGNTLLRVDGGSLTAGDIYLDARGQGGASTLFAPGGDGAGGAITVDIVSPAGQPATVDIRSLRAEAGGTGGSALIDNNTNTSGRDGGAGTGGTIAMTVGGALTLAGGEGGSELSLSANGQGGDAFAGGVGGAGTGGSVKLATVTSPGGAGTITATTIRLIADGLGGAATDPGIVIELPALDPTASSGGTGSGGAVVINANGGDITANAITPGAITASATGVGQNGAAAVPEIPGGAGGNGGDGNGGTFTLNFGGGNLVGALSTAVNGVAGAGGDGSAGGAGGNGGSAAGGSFAINLTGATTSFNLPGGLTLDLSAVAGNGGNAGDGASGAGAGGGNGGDATGGSLSLATIGGGNLSLGSLDLDASATGGNGGSGGTGTTTGASGAGGDGTGGAFSALATGGTIQLGAATVITSGYGGNSPAGTGGNGSGGLIRLAAADAPGGAASQITALATSLLANGAAGSGAVSGTANAGSIDISQASATPAGLIQFASLTAMAQGAGSATGISLLANGGTIAVTGDATIDSAGSARLSGINGGRVTVGTNLAAVAGTGITAGNLSANTIRLTALDDILFDGNVTGTNQLTAQSTSGSILTNGAVTLTAGNGSGGLLQLLSPNGINAPDAALVTGGTAQFYLGGGDFVVGSLTAGNRIDTIDASFGFTDFGQLVSAGAIRIGGTTTVANGSADLQAGTDLALGDVVAENDIRLSAPGVVSATTLTAGDDIFVDGGSIAIDTATTTGLGTDDETGYGAGDGLGNIALTADNGIDVSAIDAFGRVSATDGNGGIGIDTLRAGGDVQLFSSDGAVVVATDLATDGSVNAFGTDVTLRSLGGLTINSLTATTGNILVETGASVDVGSASAGGSLTLNAGTRGTGDARLADASAGGAIDVTARGLATLVEVIDAPTINVASYDIAIVGGEGAALIGRNTDSITLTNIGSQRTRVGGGDVSGAWSLSNDEFGRLSAHNIVIGAAGRADGASMTIGQLDIIGAAGSDTESRRRNLTGSELTLYADDEILINGAVSLTGAGADDRLLLSASNRILVDTATGAISLAGQNGGLGGTLAMDAATIFVGTAQAWADISALSGIDAKSSRLGRNDGVINPQGFLRANAMTFGASEGLYIQNTGTDTRPTEKRAGFTVGTGGVTIFTGRGEGPPLEIAINGRQTRADGTFAVGADLIPLLTLRGAGEASMAGFNPRSTANGCLIVGASCTADRPIDTGIPQQDIINALNPDPDFDGETGLLPPLNPPIIQFADQIGLSSDSIIEEPVTGTANENLWLGSDTGGPTISQQVTGTRNDDDDQTTPNDQSIDQQVTGTRNDSLDEQVTGTRKDDSDGTEKPKP